MHIERLTQPTHTPISLDELKDYLKIDHDAKDQLLRHCILAATDKVESFLGRTLMRCTKKVTFMGDNKRKTFILPSAPFLYLEGVPKINGKNCRQFFLLTGFSQATVRFKRIPALGDKIEITYECGYGDHPQEIPAIYRQGVLMQAAYLYENRGLTPPNSGFHAMLKETLSPYRRYRLA